MTDIDISRALKFDPFEGDFGSVGDKVLSDKIVTAKKNHDDCHTCGGPALAGTKNRVQIARIEGEFMTHRWCQLCTEAMAMEDAILSVDDAILSVDGDEDQDDLGPHARRINLNRH